MTKKTVALAAALALCLSAMAGCSGTSVVGNSSSVASSTAASATSSSQQEREPGLYIDGQATQPDPVLTIGSHPVNFEEYRYNYLYALSLYGGRSAENFTGENAEENAIVLRQIVEQNLLGFYAFEELAAEHNIALTDEETQQANDALQSMVDQLGGEEAMDEMLAEQNLSQELYTRLMMANQLQAKVLRELYGDDIRAGVEENYVHAQHILIQFASEENGASSGSASASAASDHSAELARAEEVLAKIEAGESFDDLMAEYSEDPGQPAEGYTFTTGEMVQEFEDAAFALEEGAVSDIVETSYGYHIIKRLPLDDTYVEENLPNMMSEEVQAVVNEDLTAIVDSMEITYCDDYEKITPDTLW